MTDRFFLVYGPELLLQDVNPGIPLDAEALQTWTHYQSVFDDNAVAAFIDGAKPGDFICAHDITVLRLGKCWNG